MRTALNALTDELRRLKGVGVKSVTVSEASLAALRLALGGERESTERGEVGRDHPAPVAPR